MGGGPSTRSGWAFPLLLLFPLSRWYRFSPFCPASVASSRPRLCPGAEADSYGGKVLGVKSHSCSLGSRARRAHELGWAGPLCSQGAQTFVLGILTLCSGSCHPTASPVRSSIPLTPTHHHGNTGSRLSQREEMGGPTPGVPEPPPQICRRTGQLSHMPELLLCTQVSPPEHPQTKTPTATDCVSRWLSPILG